MDSPTIRERFLAFFERRDHERVPSSSLVPNDPTLLLTNAGMNQFKPYFLGEQQPPFARAMTVQKCFRTTDIDEVGKTTRHLTFFEMLGNFSFGDYYKQDACPWAWELVTEGWGLDAGLLWVTIYDDDDEAFEVWTDIVKVPPNRIVRLGRKTNFWSMGVAGPCGPCSEIFVDLGEAYGPASETGPAGNEDRYLEIWNLVFMQNECDARIKAVGDLPTRNIDTGAGVERLAMVLQNADSIYDTDTLGGLVDQAAELVGRAYGSDERTDRSLRVLADHGRAMTFLIADGVLPSNEERGYVLRRVMRRAIQQARSAGRGDPVLVDLVAKTVELMGDFYPEVRTRRDFIAEVVEREEHRFAGTLRQGLQMLESEMKNARESGSGIRGDAAFMLHDTFGFPIDLTREIAEEAGLDVDSSTFERLMTQQRDRARAARAGTVADDATAAAALKDEHGSTEFVGYEHLRTEARILGILIGGEPSPVAGEGDRAEVFVDRTSFYAEGGGQVGDRGLVRATSGAARVVDARRPVPGVTAHHVVVEAGELRLGDEVELVVDANFRAGCQRAHTATHILHWILRDRLGDHARQAGSLIEAGRLRFDFNHFDALGESGVREIGAELQERVSTDDAVRAYETTFDFAKSVGAMAIFGEKYGDFVRVVEVGEYSKELCGGTHVPHTSQIGVVVVTAEGSVGANLRRVEALVGDEGLAFLQRRVAVLDRAAHVLKSTPDEVADRLDRLLTTQKEMERKLAEVERGAAEADAATLAATATDVDGAKLVVARRDLPVDTLRALAQSLRSRLGNAIVVLGASGDGKANLVAAISKDLAGRGLSARDLLRPGAELLGGGAGGKPELAVSGGPRAERIQEAIDAVAQAAKRALAE